MRKHSLHKTSIPADIQALFENLPTVDELDAAQSAPSVDFSADPQFVAGALKMQLVEDILKAMEEQGLNKNTLAERLGKSRQYVGRILNESANFTLESVAEIACTLGMQTAIRLYNWDERLELLPWHQDYGKTFALIDMTGYEKQDEQIEYDLEHEEDVRNLVA